MSIISTDMFLSCLLDRRLWSDSMKMLLFCRICVGWASVVGVWGRWKLGPIWWLNLTMQTHCPMSLLHHDPPYIDLYSRCFAATFLPFEIHTPRLRIRRIPIREILIWHDFCAIIGTAIADQTIIRLTSTMTILMRISMLGTEVLMCNDVLFLLW